MEALFKFCTGAGAIAILKHNSIFITSPLDLNDPFEMRPAWTEAHEARRHENEQLRSEMTRGMPAFVATEAGLVPSGSIPFIPPNPKLDVEGMIGISDQLNAPVCRTLHENFRVLSFVSSLFDLKNNGGESDEQATLIWSHYAEQFQGICLAVNPAKLNNGIKRGGFHVEYPPERQTLPPNHYDSWLALAQQPCDVPGFNKDAASGLLLTPSQRVELTKQRFIGLLTHKSPAWSYEKEVRFIYEIDEQRNRADYRRIAFPCPKCQAKGFALTQCKQPCYRDALELTAAAIVAVIFGADCTVTTVENVLSLIGHERYRHLDLYWSSLHSCRYAVQYIKKDASYIRDMQQERARQVAMAKNHVRRDDKGAFTFLPSSKGVNFEMSKRLSAGDGDYNI